MVFVYYYGRLGNNLGQYCFGRILAEKYGYKLNAEPIKDFVNTNENIDGKIIDSPRIKLKFNKIDIDSLTTRINETNGAFLYLRGTFSYYPNFEPHKEKIKKWLYIPKIEIEEIKNNFKILDNEFKDIEINEIEKNDVLLHIRLGDCLENRRRRKYRGLYFDYFNMVLSRIKFNRLFIISDSIDNDEIKKFQKYHPICLFNVNASNTIRFFKQFNRIIISRSSFAWWGAYLSDAQEIYYPIPKTGVWGENNTTTDADLTVNESRFIYFRQRTQEFITDFNKVKEVFEQYKK